MTLLLMKLNVPLFVIVVPPDIVSVFAPRPP